MARDHSCGVIRCAPHLAVVALLWGGCGSAPATSTRPLSFLATAFETLASSGGHLHVDVRWSPAVPAKGDDAAQLVFSDDMGNPVDGLSVDVLPWMPAHGHGTSVQPVVDSMAPGVLIVSPVYLYMSGEWQLRITVNSPLDDTAVATVQIP
jgi:hypothetical protein